MGLVYIRLLPPGNVWVEMNIYIILYKEGRVRSKVKKIKSDTSNRRINNNIDKKKIWKKHREPVIRVRGLIRVRRYKIINIIIITIITRTRTTHTIHILYYVGTYNIFPSLFLTTAVCPLARTLHTHIYILHCIIYFTTRNVIAYSLGWEGRSGGGGDDSSYIKNYLTLISTY